MYETLEETAQHIQALQKQRLKLLQEVSEIERELCSAQARHGKLLNLTAPVSKLPNELLANIFHTCQRIWPTASPALNKPFEVVASHVSSRWREIVLGTPLLWNTISLVVTRHQHQDHALQRLSAHLTRSGQCLLDIYINITTPQNISRVLYTLTPHADRWYRVSISLTRGLPNDIYAPLYSVAAPALIHLSLRIGNHRDEPHSPRIEYPNICPPILTRGSPSLSFVRVAGMVVGNLTPPLGAVTILHIDAWPNNIMSHAQFISMINALPCLVNLSLTGLSINLSRDPLSVSDPISIPTLRSLRIRGNATPCHRLLSLMAMPNLESLSLDGIDTFDSITIPTLCSLTLDSCSLTKDELRNIVRAFPGVSTLRIDDSSPGIYSILGSDTEHLWPGLETIQQRQLPPTDVAAFYLLMLRRVSGDASLRRVDLDKRSRTVLRKKSILDELHKLLPIGKCDHLDPWPLDLEYDDPDDVWY